MTQDERQAFSAQTVEAVKQQLPPEDLKLFNSIRFPGDVHTGVTLAYFLERLFDRAPQEVIDAKDATSLVSIVKGCLGALRKMVSDPARVAISLNTGSNELALFVALDDCPFIVSSVAERLSEAGVRVNAFLHPILVFNEAVIALSYIDISFFPAEAVATVESSVRASLILLKQVVKDFESMTEQVRRCSDTLTGTTLASDFGPLAIEEVRSFLAWLVDGSFFMLGSATLKQQLDAPFSASAGLWNIPSEYRSQILGEIKEDVAALERRNVNISLTKLRSTSAVHRPASLMHVLVRSQPGGSLFSLVGYLTSKAWTVEAQDIPIVRQKVSKILLDEEAVPNSHDYKYMAEVVDHMPTDDAMCSSVEHLKSVIHLALGMFSREVTRSLTEIDPLARRASTVVVLPPERYSATIRGLIRDAIEHALGATWRSSDVHLDSSKRRQLRLYFSTPLPYEWKPTTEYSQLPSLISQLTLSWEDRVADPSNGRLTATHLAGLTFPDEYKAAVSPQEARDDITHLLELSDSQRVLVFFSETNEESDRKVATVFSLRTELSISQVLPVLENVSLEVLGAHSYWCRSNSGQMYILKLSVRPYGKAEMLPAHFNAHVAPGIAAILRGEAQNDLLNQLLRSTPLTVRQITLLRTYCAFLWQANKMSTRRTMWEALVGAPATAVQLYRIFEAKFDTARPLSMSERQALAKTEEASLTEALRAVTDITHDKVIKGLLSLVRATVRTNFYNGNDTIALKVRSVDVEVMPHPRPLFEIFVYSPRIEGTHLRSTKVARGGIRWSERIDDFRSEVLGLMKTQKVKNVIIVPGGAKGGFIVKNLPKEGDAIPAAVEGSYREYVTALLSITDNKKGDEVVHPSGIVVHDDPDPYFVVAADKGTATFSDVANKIAVNDFNFWLGDAFASGGSAGYDHKKYGITAKGGWECVCRHFRDLGIDYQHSAFTVIGIGDMSGDVFGNGLLLSRKMALVAAFNHKHIFIDPTPDPESSYEERSRLFQLKRSQWSDYDARLLSRGGGVFGRFDKEIALTPEIRSALGIASDAPPTVDGETLINLILRAPVDLLWNGGIGTYVKAADESHSQVNDGTNDGVRINANELRARVVGEGGNLGLTQRARVEFSLNGGRVNTDAIDNSGGVDLSDHEVNLKLLFGPLVTNGALSKEQRDEVLRAIDKEVVTSVLQHNADQALMLTVSSESSKASIDPYRYLIRDMHRLGFLDRNRDGLPDDAEMEERSAAKVGLCRPELAVCSAAVKMWIKDDVRSSPLSTDENLTPFLLGYFPRAVREKFTSCVLEHPLRADIIASEVVNSLLPCVGISFVHSAATAQGLNPSTVMKCLLAADRILCTDTLRERIRKLDTVSTRESFYKLWHDLGRALRAATGWLMSLHGRTSSLEEMVNLYSDGFDTLIEHAKIVFTGRELERHERRVSQYIELGASSEDAVTFSLYRRIVPALEVLWTAREFHQPVPSVAIVFSYLLNELGVTALFKFENVLNPTNKWELELISGAFQEIRRSISLLSGKLLTRGVTDHEGVRAALTCSPSYEAIRTTMTELEELGAQARPFPVAILPVVARQLRLFQLPD